MGKLRKEVSLYLFFMTGSRLHISFVVVERLDKIYLKMKLIPNIHRIWVCEIRGMIMNTKLRDHMHII